MIKIKQSNRNTNKHTEVGMQLIEKSITDFGVLESISVATDHTIISGHARKELFDKKGMQPKFIKLEPGEYAVLETNIQNNSKEYFQAQILANTSANKNFDLDIEMIELISEEFNINIEECGVDVEEIDFDDIKSNADRENDKPMKQVTCPSCGHHFAV